MIRNVEDTNFKFSYKISQQEHIVTTDIDLDKYDYICTLYSLLLTLVVYFEVNQELKMSNNQTKIPQVTKRPLD